MTCMDSYVGRKEKQHSVKTIPVCRTHENLNFVFWKLNYNMNFLHYYLDRIVKVIIIICSQLQKEERHEQRYWNALEAD